MPANNPFFHRGPIRDSRYFWNRGNELARALFLVLHAQSVSIVGPRRIGRTSFLYQLERDLAAAQTPAIGAPICVVIFQCEGWSQQSRESIYAQLRNAICLTLQRMEQEDVLWPAGCERVETLSYRTFNSEIRRVVEKGVRLLLVFDEFEALATNPHLDAGFFSGLRALATNYQVTFVTSTKRSLGALTFAEPSVLSSPFFNVFSQVNLRPFTDSEAVEMLEGYTAMGGVTFDDDLFAFLLSLAGPHPFFLQVAGFYAYERCVETGGALTDADYAWIRREFTNQSDSHWRYCWHSLSLAQQQTLACHNDQERLNRANLHSLVDLGLMVERDGEYVLLSSTLADFVARRPVEGLIQAPPVLIDLARRRVLIDGRALDFNRLEFEMLVLLAEDPGRIQSFMDIEARLWPEDKGQVDDPERLKGVVKGLRRKLKERSYPDLIKNERGVGYRLAGRRVQASL